MTTHKQIKDFSRKYAESNGFILNEKVADTVINGLLRNQEKFGARYCPCRKRTGNKEEDRKIICPCIYHKDEIKQQGFCHCMLFISEDFQKKMEEQK